MGTDIADFRAWLLRRGRTESTAQEYGRALRRLLAVDDPIAPLLDRDSAPATRNHNATVLRQWAVFSENITLQKQIKEIRLPHPGRKQVRVPCEQKEWFDIIDHVQSADYLNDVERAVVEIIVVRGIRCGDVLRLRKTEVEEAVKTGRLGFEGKGERRIVFGAQNILEPLKALNAMSWPRSDRVWGLVSPRAASVNARDAAGRRIRTCFKKIEHKLKYSRGEIYAHRFRHTYVNSFLDAMSGDPAAIFKLQSQMGWSNMSTAQSYVKQADTEELSEIENKMFKK